jgi:hypothetical protein
MPGAADRAVRAEYPRMPDPVMNRGFAGGTVAQTSAKPNRSHPQNLQGFDWGEGRFSNAGALPFLPQHTLFQGLR